MCGVRGTLRGADNPELGSTPRVHCAVDREVASGDVYTPGGPSPQGAFPSTRTRVALNIPAVLARSLLVAVCYYPATQRGFVWADSLLMRDKPTQSLSGSWQVWFKPSTIDGNEAPYRPVLSTLFWLEHRLWGLTPAGFHIVTVLLHLDVTPLLWHLLLRLARPGAWGVAMVFAIQPRHPRDGCGQGYHAKLHPAKYLCRTTRASAIPSLPMVE